MGVGVVQIHWFKWGETVLCLISFVQAAALVWMALTEHILIAYFAFVIYRILYQVLITVARLVVLTIKNQQSVACNITSALFIETQRGSSREDL